MRALLLAVLALASLRTPALADEPAPAAPRPARPAETTPAPWVGSPVLPARTGHVALVQELRLATFRILPDELGTPWATSIDAAVAITPRLTLGLSHSSRALGTIDRGLGWCHEGGTHRCRAAYAGGFLDARRHLASRGALHLAFLGRAGAAATGPIHPAVRLGLSLRRAGRVWLVAEPEFQIALGGRADGNRDTLIAPLWLGVGQRRAAAWIATGLRGGLVGFGEKWEIPLVLGGGVAIGRARAGLEAGFPRLLGPQNTGNVRHGALWLALTW